MVWDKKNLAMHVDAEGTGFVARPVKRNAILPFPTAGDAASATTRRAFV
jgi:hypothetical protein